MYKKYLLIVLFLISFRKPIAINVRPCRRRIRISLLPISWTKTKWATIEKKEIELDKEPPAADRDDGRGGCWSVSGGLHKNRY